MITVTEQASSRIKAMLARRGKGAGIRLGVKTTGCSGLAYMIEFVDDPAPEDLLFTDQDVNMYVDPKSYVYIAGLVVDWVRVGLNEGFDFSNPNERDRCGCGESFRV